MRFGNDFGRVLAKALGQNAAVHDGAVMLRRASTESGYVVSGWSYRLHPPSVNSGVSNKGSAFNSCIAMSYLSSVDMLFLIARDGVFAFVDGEINMLS